MPELPWIKWFPANWYSEPGLAMCDAATRGVWADAINVMLLHGEPSICGTVDQLSRLCRCRPTQMQAAICELQQFNVCIVLQDSDAANNAQPMQEKSVTLVCRRLSREFSIKDKRRKAANVRWKKNDAPRNARSASASAYASNSSLRGSAEGEVNHPTMAAVIEHFSNPKNGGWPERDIRQAFNTFEANSQDGWWMWGSRRVGDWRAAMETRLNDQKDRHANHSKNGKPNPRNAGIATDPTEQGKRIAETIAKRNQTPR